MSTVKIGDYVLASKWSDESPSEPWSIGFISEIDDSCDNGIWYKLKGEGVLKRSFANVREISQQEGEKILKERKRDVFVDYSVVKVMPEICEKTLLEMGFVVGEGWGHKVYYHYTDFWVHYGEYKPSLEGQQVSSKSSMSEFFTLFIEHLLDKEV